MAVSTVSKFSAIIIGSKVGSMLAMMIMAIVGALIPLLLRRFKMHIVRDLSNAVAGGAFLSLGFFHILPDAVDELRKANLILYIDEAEFNLAYVFVFVGYIIILFAESVIFDPALKENVMHNDRIDAHYGSPSELVAISSICHNIQDNEVKSDKNAIKECYFSEAIGQNCERSWIRKEDEVEGIRIHNSSTDCSKNTIEENYAHNNSNKAVCYSKQCNNNFENEKNRMKLNYGELPLEDASGTGSPTVFTSSSHSLNKLTLNRDHCCEKNQVENYSNMNGNIFSSGVFFLMLALAIHGFFEGVIVGTCSNVMSVWMTTLVILGHKWAESFALMSQMIFQNLRNKDKILLMAVFVFSTPVGIAAGIGFSDVNLYSGICNALGTGTVIFVAGEITLELFSVGGKLRFVKFVMYLFGSLFVFGLTIIGQYAESKI